MSLELLIMSHVKQTENVSIRCRQICHIKLIHKQFAEMPHHKQKLVIKNVEINQQSKVKIQVPDRKKDGDHLMLISVVKVKGVFLHSNRQMSM